MRVWEAFRKVFWLFGSKVGGVGEKDRCAFAGVEHDDGAEACERIEDIPFGIFERAAESDRTTEGVSASDKCLAIGFEPEESAWCVGEYPVHEDGEVFRIVEEPPVIDECMPVFRKFRPDKHVAECLVASVAQAIEEEDNIDNARHFELARRVAGIGEGEASHFKVAGFRHEDIKGSDYGSVLSLDMRRPRPDTHE